MDYKIEFDEDENQFIPVNCVDEFEARHIYNSIRATDIINQRISKRNALPFSESLDIDEVFSWILSSVKDNSVINEAEDRAATFALGIAWSHAISSRKAFIELLESLPDKFVVAMSATSKDKAMTLKAKADGTIEIVKDIPVIAKDLAASIHALSSETDNVKFQHKGVPLRSYDVAIDGERLVILFDADHSA